jgi:hypothetical protein
MSYNIYLFCLFSSNAPRNDNCRVLLAGVWSGLEMGFYIVSDCLQFVEVLLRDSMENFMEFSERNFRFLMNSNVFSVLKGYFGGCAKIKSHIFSIVKTHLSSFSEVCMIFLCSVCMNSHFLSNIL